MLQKINRFSLISNHNIDNWTFITISACAYLNMASTSINCSPKCLLTHRYAFFHFLLIQHDLKKEILKNAALIPNYFLCFLQNATRTCQEHDFYWIFKPSYIRGCMKFYHYRPRRSPIVKLTRHFIPFYLLNNEKGKGHHRILMHLLNTWECRALMWNTILKHPNAV